MNTLLKEIEKKLDCQSLISLEQAKKEIDEKWSGFYWIYTNKTLADFLKSSTPMNPNHVNLRYRSTIHRNLNHVIYKKENEEYWCIYNGKGVSLKNRLRDEFTANVFTTRGKKKGEFTETRTLALTRCFNEKDFKVKYIACDTNNLKGITAVYECLENDLERIWRLNNGWPIFCCL